MRSRGYRPSGTTHPRPTFCRHRHHRDTTLLRRRPDITGHAEPARLAAPAQRTSAAHTKPTTFPGRQRRHALERRVITELDIWRAAELLIRRHGRQSPPIQILQHLEPPQLRIARQPNDHPKHPPEILWEVSSVIGTGVSSLYCAYTRESRMTVMEIPALQ